MRPQLTASQRSNARGVARSRNTRALAGSTGHSPDDHLGDVYDWLMSAGLSPRSGMGEAWQRDLAPALAEALAND